MTFRRGTLTVIAVLAITWLTSDVAAGRQGCVTGFNPLTLSVPVSGGPVHFNVSTSSPTCQWNFGRFELPGGTVLMVPPEWTNFPTPFMANGPTTARLDVWANHEAAPRNITLFIGGQSISMTQPGNPCPLTVSPVSPATMPANGGIGSFVVSTSGSSCSYSTLPSEGVTIASGGSAGTFPATVTFSVPPNSTPQPVQRAVYVSSIGTFMSASRLGVVLPGVTFVQNGSPVATDAPASGYMFAVHRPGTTAEHVSAPEPLRITNTENATASWVATTSEPWLVVSPSSGISPATAAISINTAAAAVLTRGTYVGTISIVSSVAPSSPKSVTVRLSITDPVSITTGPGGFLDIPLQGATGLSGAVPIGGWAADDVGIRRVQIFRNSIGSEPIGEVYLGDATRVRGARPDVAGGPARPEITRAGWGFMLLSNVLPSGGNGTHTLSAYAEDIEGKRTLIGQKTVTFDNTNSVFPFGTIDQPSQGGNLSGMTASVVGWVLAQPGKSIPFDGSTIQLLIDGVVQPNMATYGVARPDVAGFFPFPSYVNANGPGAQFVLDTTQFANGLHTIVWVARDDLGVVQGIGSRYFTIENGASSQSIAPVQESRSAAAIQALPQATAFVWNRQGFDNRRWSLQFAGGRTNEIQQAPGERLEVTLDTWWWSPSCGTYEAYLLKGDVAGPLPPGASINGETGVFTWLPPVEFSGTFEFVFVRRACSDREERIPLRVVIEPR